MLSCGRIAAVAAAVVMALPGGCGGSKSQAHCADGVLAQDDGCRTGGADEVDGPEVLEPPEKVWTPGPEALGWPHWTVGREWMKDVSLWSHALDQKPTEPTHVRFFSDLAVGNGTIFSLVGYPGPFNRFHSMVGPGYERGPMYFSDTWLEVRKAGGTAWKWQKEWIGRVNGTPIVWTQAESSIVGLATVDAAVMVDNNKDPLSRAIVRVAIVANRSSSKLSGLELAVKFAREQVPFQGSSSEDRDGDRRTVLLAPGTPISLMSKTGDPLPDVQAGDPTASSAGLVVPLPDIEPGAEAVVPLAYVVDAGDAEFEATAAALEGKGIDALFEQTRDGWAKRLEPATKVVSPDPMVDQYLEQTLLVLLTQQSAGGAICPMSEYTHFWPRDTAGPVRFLVSMGMFEEARKLLDYFWYGSVVGSGVKNAYSSDLDPSQDLPQEPDWDSLPALEGKAGAETPSHVSLLHYWYWVASGNLDFMPARLEFMKYATWKQAFSGDLLPFSGDETYRTAMAVAHDMPLLEQYVPGYFSPYSTFLWVVAAEGMARMCDAIGEAHEAATLRTRAEAVRKATDETFRRTDGAYLPYVQEGTLKPAKVLFEDVSMQPAWLGYVPPDGESAVANLTAAIDELGGEDGILVSPLPASYQGLLGLPISKGIYTGMNPGYYLWALAGARHPLSEAAFNAIRFHTTPTGTAPEYQILDDFTPLHLAYSEVGAEPADYTARYRPWEGGINAEAVLYFILGNRQDAVLKKLALSPNLPNGWSWLEAHGLRVGDTRVDVRIERPSRSGERPAAPEWTVALTNTSSADSADSDLLVDLGLPVSPGSVSAGAGPAASATVDGAPIDAAVDPTPWGGYVVRLADIPLPAGATAKVVVETGE